MKNKTIRIKDSSNGRIFLAWKLLDWLNNSPFNVFINESEYQKNIQTLIVFTKISKSNAKIPDLTIEITSNIKGNISEDLLYYPIVDSSVDIFDLNLDYYLPVQNNDHNFKQPHLQDVNDYISRKFATKTIKDKKVLISAGPTIEDLDAVRFLSNRSTGKMGIALARAAFCRGADVCLVCGPTHQRIPNYLKIYKVRGAAEMESLVLEKIKWSDIFFSCAAVADYTPTEYHIGKLKKGSGNLKIELKRTVDILIEAARLKTNNQKFIGFSVETDNLIENSQKKLVRKKLDMIVANNPMIKGAGFENDTNQVEIITKDDIISLPLSSKLEVAHKIIDNLTFSD